MDLGLGTVQFGLAYGVAGRTAPVPPAEVRDILACAAERGVRVLDTAPAYGDIEAQLSALAHPHAFQVVSKIQPCPADLAGPALQDWARDQVERSVHRIGPGALRTLLFHRSDDLLAPQGPALWEACARVAGEHGIALGVSCYAPDTLQALQARWPVAVAQLPGNALDRRFTQLAASAQNPTEIHLRSVFLQGLLLMDESRACARQPAAAAALRRWHAWCRARGIAPLEAALGSVKASRWAHVCLVGADSLAQFQAIVDAWDRAAPLHAADLQESDLRVIDPRTWTQAAP